LGVNQLPPLLLASSSPRRRDLIAQLGVEPAAIFSPDIDETPRRREDPAHYALRMAREKAAAAVGQLPSAVILAADTTVAAGQRIIGPPTRSDDEVAACLQLLSGRRHRVHSAVCVIDAKGVARERLSTTIVAFKRLSAKEIDAYVACGEGMGKAGGYAIQGRAAGFTKFVSGSYSGVVGLPLFETRALLVTAGVIVA
jgi:septum formation protein